MFHLYRNTWFYNKIAVVNFKYNLFTGALLQQAGGNAFFVEVSDIKFLIKSKNLKSNFGKGIQKNR
jgi:hypothetical protein